MGSIDINSDFAKAQSSIESYKTYKDLKKQYEDAKKRRGESFEKKKEEYAKEVEVEITQDVSRRKKWDAEEIENRSEYLAAYAVEIWSLP